jgi:hypothetical protein
MGNRENHRRIADFDECNHIHCSGARWHIRRQVAGAELLGSPEVKAAMAGLEKYTDKTKLEALAKK